MKKISIFVSFILIASSLFGQEEVKMKDGNTIILNKNGTWIYKKGIQTYNTFTDPRDGQVYKIVTIGKQVWMAENLKTTKYRNGDPIPTVYDDKEWSNLSTGAYCNYNNDENNAKTYGRLYNWYAVTDSRKIAPIGWHVASDEEWTTLTTFLGGAGFAGGKLKEIGTSHWKSPNTEATNDRGFTALPGGARYGGGEFGAIGEQGYWTCSNGSPSNPWYRRMHYKDGEAYREFISPKGGFSIRCIKD